MAEPNGGIWKTLWLQLFSSVGISKEEDTGKMNQKIERSLEILKEVKQQWRIDSEADNAYHRKLTQIREKAVEIQNDMLMLQKAEEDFPRTARIIAAVRPIKLLFVGWGSAILFLAVISKWQPHLLHTVAAVFVLWLLNSGLGWDPKKYGIIWTLWKQENIFKRAEQNLKDIECKIDAIEWISEQRNSDMYAVRAKLSKIGKAYEVYKQASGDSVSVCARQEWESLKSWLNTCSLRWERHQKRNKVVSSDQTQFLFVNEYKVQFKAMLAQIPDFWSDSLCGGKSDMIVSRAVEGILTADAKAGQKKDHMDEKRKKKTKYQPVMVVSERETEFFTMLLDPNKHGTVSVEDLVAFMQYFGPIDACVTKIRPMVDAQWFRWPNSPSYAPTDPFGESKRNTKVPDGTTYIRASRKKGCFTYCVKLPGGKTLKIRIVNDPGPSQPETKQNQGRVGGMYYWMMQERPQKCMFASNLAEAKHMIEKILTQAYFFPGFKFKPFRDMNTMIKMKVGGVMFEYELSSFLKPEHAETKLHSYFSNADIRNCNTIHSFSEDPEIFREVCLFHLYNKTPDFKKALGENCSQELESELDDKWGPFQNRVSVVGSPSDDDGTWSDSDRHRVIDLKHRPS
ncbi:hypothetical protein AAMO2058_000785400 [Amorphochlora amoebiformis]